VTEKSPEPEAPAARPVIEHEEERKKLEEEHKKNEAIAIRLSRYADKGVLTAEELASIRAEFPVPTPPPSIVLENRDGIPSDKPRAMKHMSSFDEGDFEREMNVVRKHFPDAIALMKKEAGTGKDVIVMVGIDPETLNSVIKMEAIRDKAVERVNEIDKRIMSTGKKIGPGDQVVDVEKLSRVVDDLARSSGVGQSRMDESTPMPLATPQGRNRVQHRTV